MVSTQTHTHTPNSPPLRQAAGRSLTFHDSLASLKYSAPSTTGFLCFPPGGERQRRAGELTAARCRLLSSSSLMALTCCPEISTHCHALRRRLLPAALGGFEVLPPCSCSWQHSHKFGTCSNDAAEVQSLQRATSSQQNKCPRSSFVSAAIRCFIYRCKAA